MRKLHDSGSLYTRQKFPSLAVIVQVALCRPNETAPVPNYRFWKNARWASNLIGPIIIKN